jgi:hypothetical protein
VPYLTPKTSPQKSKYELDTRQFEAEKTPEAEKQHKTAFISLRQRDVIEEKPSKRKSKALSGYPTQKYEGQVESIERDKEIDSTPLNAPYSTPTAQKIEAEKVNKKAQISLRKREIEEKPLKSAYPTQHYEGPLESIEREKEIDITPPDASYLTPTAQKIESEQRHKTAHISLRQYEIEEKPLKSAYPTQKYEGPLELVEKNTEIDIVPNTITPFDVPYPSQKTKRVKMQKHTIYNLDRTPYSTDQILYHEAHNILPISDYIEIRDVPSSSNKRSALIYIKSFEQPRLEKRSIWSITRKRRRETSPSTPLETVAAARKAYDSELVGGMAIGNAALFYSGEPVTDMNIDLFLRKRETAQYHIEVLLRDMRTSEFPVLFNGRRGPKFLPRSLLESALDEASFSIREPRNKRPKPDSDQQRDVSPKKGEEADESSLASQDDDDNTPKRHKLHHHRTHGHESSQQHKSQTLLDPHSESSKKVSGSLLSSFRQQLSQVSFWSF